MTKKDFYDIKKHQKATKIALGISLGVLCVSALNINSKTMKKAHIISGIALVGLSLYHTNLYSGPIPKILNKKYKEA